ncbi:MAG TPA: cyclic nucleotide-binding domain-containing protein [Ktedonobacterales bacterium]|nr:cyclic nucleotide-binding domain-containing protein [Ktedonobacterales bacterium]
MSAPLLGKHFAELQSASTPTIAVAAAGSFAGQVAAVVQAAPLWLYVVAAVAPWIPILVLELIWTYRHYRWLAVFCLLIVTQSAYLLEQVARIVQVHVLNTNAPGIFGALDVDRVHLVWTSWAVLGVLLLVTRFPRNPWLWVTLALVSWDAVQRRFLPAQVDLEFVYSVLEIAALNLAFALQLGRTYDAWLARVFPQLPERVLIDTTGLLEELRLRPGERVEHVAQRLYIVTRGTGVLIREGPGGHDILLGVLAPGQIVSADGTLQAETALELLALPAGAL